MASFALLKRQDARQTMVEMFKPFSSVLFVVVLSMYAVAVANASARPIRVACVGDSITFGIGVSNPARDAYPAVLGRMLGSDYDVRNFGVSGRTMLKKGDYPIWKEQTFTNALEFKPDVLVVLLGTNDSKRPNDRFPHAPNNWQYADEYVPNYEEMIADFRQANPKVKVYVCLPPPAFPGQWGITEQVMTNDVAPRVREVAKATGATLIDLHTPLTGHGNLFPDTVHPNVAGARLLASTVYHALTGKLAQRAGLYPNSLFQDKAVLQRDVRVPVWGEADPGERVTVTFDDQTVTTVVKNRHWKVWLKPMNVDVTPQTMTIQGGNGICIHKHTCGWPCDVKGAGFNPHGFGLALAAGNGKQQAVGATARVKPCAGAALPRTDGSERNCVFSHVVCDERAFHG